MEDKKNIAAEEGSQKLSQLAAVTVDNLGAKMTTDMGIKVENTIDSLKAGVRGPTLLSDFHLREKIMHFDHERIPERVVHARGSGAHGIFELYESMEEYTKAAFLQDPKVKTPVFARFSTVVGSRGSADTVRDARGFATKFYTQEGNYDLVGNNMPVFFIQDAIKFPDIIHSIKPEPENEIPQATAAHDTFWDFVVNNPETAHMVMWVMSERGIPRSYRMMEGFGVNTFRFINKKGVSRFVKFHWKPVLGVHSLVRDEAQKIGGKDPDFHRRDLYDAIERGHYPEYELGVQMIEESKEHDFDFDILDPTKLWPEETVPVKLIGKMTLFKNPDNFFAETEQVAFCPANIVPGIDFSNDPLLQGRLFSYLDTQLLRLGGPNFHQIPINKAVAPVHNNQRDGFMRMTIDKGKAAYSPNSIGLNSPETVKEADGGYVHYEERVDGRVIRTRSKSFADHFTQAAMFWNSLTPPERATLIDGFRFEAGSVKDPSIRQKVVEMFANVSTELARVLAEGMGVQVPGSGGKKSEKAGSSPALSTSKASKTPYSKKVALLIEPGFCLKTLEHLQNAFTAAGAVPVTVSARQGSVKSAEGKPALAIKDYATTDSVLFDAVCAVGGIECADALAASVDSRNFVNDAYKHYKAVIAAGEAVDFLSGTDAKYAELSSGKTVTSRGVVTCRDTSDLERFAGFALKAIAEGRHWERSANTLPAE